MFCSFLTRTCAGTVLLFGAASASAQSSTYSWRYYRPTNTGIQGDYCDALYLGADGDPWIGGYDPGFEEGGLAKFVQAENRWVNVSNVDYPVIGHPNDTGTSRVSEIVADAQGNLWMGTGRGALKFNPSVGPSSLVKYDASNSPLPGGWTTGVELAPDGSLWFSAYATVWGGGGLRRFDPASNLWSSYAGYGNGSVAVQPKPGGGYFVWSVQLASGQIARFDSTTQAWTNFTQSTNAPWSLPGKACTDAQGNTWMYRLTGPSFALQVLDCRRPDGSWINPPLPSLPAVNPPVWALRAFGNQQALLADGNSQIWRFDGASWQNLGVWRQGAYTEDLGIDATGNVWACGIGGAAKRDALTGVWQRYRVTNTSQYDFFNNGLSIDAATGKVYACANAGGGIGGMEIFDGVRWTGVNDAQYGLGISWPFPTDSSDCVAWRPSLQAFAVNPMYNGIAQYDGASWTTLQAGTTSAGMVEDSLGRLWRIGEYFSLQVHDGTSWSSVPILGWGANIQKDLDRPGTVWACANGEVVRTDGTYRVSWANTSFVELDPQSDVLTTVAAGRNGIAWVGATHGLFRLDANTGLHTYFPPSTPWLHGTQIAPLAVTPDGRVWFANFGDGSNPTSGLGWYDGANSGFFAGPVPSGSPQWGGLPHAQIAGLEVRTIPGGYELWMSCLSRGLAVLTVQTDASGTLFCAGDGTQSTPCPCGNSGAPGHGCANSSVAGGASLAATGTTAPDALVLHAAQMLPSATCIFLQGDAALASGVVFGDGVRCVGGQLLRIGVKSAVAGVAGYPAAGDLPISARAAALGTPIVTGSARWYQTYYRDPVAAFCPDPPGKTWNVTNGVIVNW